MPTIINAKEASKFLKINLYTLYAYSRRRLVPSIRIGRLVRFDLTELEKWLESKKIKEMEK
jgi:excisionase family DNA binding protein